LGLLAFYGLVKSLKARRESSALFFSVIFFFAGYLGLIASIYPYAIPPSITFQEAAAQHETLRFTLWGVIIVLPLVVDIRFIAMWFSEVRSGRRVIIIIKRRNHVLHHSFNS